MRIREISDEQKSFLTLQGIKFTFANEYNNIVSAFSVIGKSNHRRRLLFIDIEGLIYDINLFLNKGYPDNDPDIILANEIYTELQDIKNKL